jgi:cell wall-associated NlpC family hydrolase
MMIHTTSVIIMQSHKFSVRHLMNVGLIPVLALAAAALWALPAQATTYAQNPPRGFHLMWATRTAMRLGWSASRGAHSYSYRLYQMNGARVRSGWESGSYHTVIFTALHPGWKYRAIVWANPAYIAGSHATLYVTLPSPTPPREHAYQWAESKADTPYVYGGRGPGGYDCSGLVQAAYAHAGIWLPRTTGEMLGYWKLERESSPRQGDLVFFGTGHVELYDSRGRSFGAESGPNNGHAGAWWYPWWPGNWWPTAFYRVHGAD